MFGDTPKSHATSVVRFPFIPSIACIPARSAAVLTTLCEPTRGPGFVEGSRTFPVLRYTSIHRFALRHVVWAAFAMLRMLPFLFFLYFAMMRQRPSNVRPVDLLLDGMLLLRRSGKWVRESDGGATVSALDKGSTYHLCLCTVTAGTYRFRAVSARHTPSVLQITCLWCLLGLRKQLQHIATSWFRCIKSQHELSRQSARLFILCAWVRSPPWLLTSEI